MGVDIGTTQLRVAVRRGDEISIARRDITAEAYQEGQLVPSYISGLLKRAREELNIPIGTPCVSSLNDRTSTMRTLRLPEMTHAELIQALPWEAEQIMPLTASEIYADGVKLNTPTDKGLQMVALIAAPRTEINNHMEMIRQGELHPMAIEPRAQAMVRRFINSGLLQDAEKNTHLLLDMGSSSTTLVLLQNQNNEIHEISSRVLSIGGDTITDNIAKAIEANFEEAENFKLTFEQHREQSSTHPSSDYRLALESINTNMAKLSREIINSLEAYNSLHGKRPNSLNICGGGALLQAAVESLAANTRMPVGLNFGRDAHVTGSAEFVGMTIPKEPKQKGKGRGKKNA